MSAFDESTRRTQRPLSESTAHGHVPLQVIHILGQFMRIWSVYATYQYLAQTGIPVIEFIFVCLFLSAVLFLIMQAPWKGRPLSHSQVVPSIINGGILALYFVLWGRGLESCGPVRTTLSEYAGACLGVLSGFLYGRRPQIWRKVGGFVAMMAAFYFLSQGWFKANNVPISFKGGLEDIYVSQDGKVKIGEMMTPIFAGILSAVRRVVARRVSLKTQWKRRLHAITIASATCFLFPFAIWHLVTGANISRYFHSPHISWAYISTILFGIIFSYYVESLAEDRLHLVVSSPRHLAVTACCIIVLEQFYKMEFSLLGFLICSSILGLGMFEATSLDPARKGIVNTQDVPSEDFNDPSAKVYLPS